jgi:apolipoprotein N-acyltransferase
MSSTPGGGGDRGMIGSSRARLVGLAARQPDLAAAGLGMLSALALPPLHVVPVLLVAIPGLLRLLADTTGPRQALRRGWWFGFGHHVIGLYWITEAILVEAARFWWLVPLAVPALAAVLAAFIAVPVAAARWLPAGWARALGLAGAWVLADLARQFVLTGFPWNPWGSAWAVPGPVGDLLLQPAALIGVHGLTLATILLAAAPTLGRRGICCAVGLLAVWLGFGAGRLSGAEPAAPDQLVVVAQGNVVQGEKWNQARAIGIFDRYLNLTAQGLARAGAHPAVVVWPETASPFQLATDLAARLAIAEAASGRTVLAGSVRFDANARPRNSLIPVLASGAPGEIYDKWHLVPFGEYQPDWFPLPIQVVPGGGFAAGPGPRTVRADGIPPFGPLICYEAIFPGEIVDRADRPAWLVNVTNDAWFGQSTGPYQHLAAARLRAIEEGIPLVRAANTGISAVFDARGRELGRLHLGQSGFLVLGLPGALQPGLFARWGLIVPALLALGAWMLGAGIRVRQYTVVGDKAQLFNET